MPVDQALAQLLGTAPQLPVETVPLNQLAGRFLAEEIRSIQDFPLFHNSAMDGYAVRSADLREAGETKPVGLTLAGRIPAGETYQGSVQPGACVRIFTGSAMPAGADAVVMQEEVRVEQNDPETIWFTAPAQPGENVRCRGEDLRRGDLLLKQGERMNAVKIGVLAAMGMSEVKSARKARVVLLATGNELREPGSELREGEIYESNRSMLAAALAGLPVEVEVFPIQRDSLEEIGRTLDRALERADFVISSGGVSVGELDFVKEAFIARGGEVAFWRVAMRPGKPFMFGKRGASQFFGLPGNPVSAWVTYQVLVRPVLLKAQGATDLDLPFTWGRMQSAAANPGDRRHYARVHLDEQGNVRLAKGQGSHLLHSLAQASGLLEMAPGMELREGEFVRVLRPE